MDIAFRVFDRLGRPLHLQKCEGPPTVLVFLGIELDSVQQFARLPRDEVDRIFRLLQSWSRKTTCSRRDLGSLIESLHHAYRVVISGRTFLRRMIDLLCCFRHRNHPISLNVEFRRDLHWWLSFFQEWNGMLFFLSPSVSPLPDWLCHLMRPVPVVLDLSGAPTAFAAPGFFFHLTCRLLFSS
jgi:hypothetical protein